MSYAHAASHTSNGIPQTSVVFCERNEAYSRHAEHKTKRLLLRPFSHFAAPATGRRSPVASFVLGRAANGGKDSVVMLPERRWWPNHLSGSFGDLLSGREAGLCRTAFPVEAGTIPFSPPLNFQEAPG